MDTTGTDDWFARLIASLVASVPSGGGASAAVVGIDEEERRLLLDLARIAAHTSERWTAPVSTFLAGVALAELDAPARRAALAAIVAALDATD